jgi:DNA (cytosine-5)-methyltransferase 1
MREKKNGRRNCKIPSYFLSLFAGIGGFDLGAYWAGLRFDGHYFSEIDQYAAGVFQKRFPEAVALGDVRSIEYDKLPKGDWIITGGPPCQDISVAGKGAGLDGDRSGLWFEYARIIGKIRPRFAIMENVGALTFRGLDRVIRSLAEIGYDAEWQDIRASDVGAPHRRERIWIVSYPHIIDDDTSGHGTGKICGERSPETEVSRNDPDADSKRCQELLDQITTWAGDANSPSCRNGIGNFWAVEPGVGRVANGVSSRVDRLKGLGNSVVPQIPELIFMCPAFDRWRRKE